MPILLVQNKATSSTYYLLLISCTSFRYRYSESQSKRFTSPTRVISSSWKVVGNTKQETYYDFINKCMQCCFAVDRVLFSKHHIRRSYISSRSRLPDSQLSRFIFHCISLDTSSRMFAEWHWTDRSNNGNISEHFIHKVVQCYTIHQQCCYRMCCQVQFHRL